jgi:porphyrinogen peroxidase
MNDRSFTSSARHCQPVCARGLRGEGGSATPDRELNINRSGSTDIASYLPQLITGKLTHAAIFLVVTVNQDADSADTVRSVTGDVDALVRSVGFGQPDGGLTCVVGFGSDAWDRLFGAPRPAELHAFREIHTATRHAVSTPGDVLFHIRAERADLCFELATLIMTALGDAVTVADEVQGFQYLDRRDLLGFVDGTENPIDQDAVEAAFVTDSDPEFAGGSYIIVQKYLHDMGGWNGLSTEAQERIIGRTKLQNVELDEAVKPTSAHNALTVIVEDGKEMKILRHNMPFGSPGHGEFGTYFIGCCNTPRTIEQMLENMFIGRPPGNYDRLLDFSRAVTGSLFFAPSATFLERVAAGEIPAGAQDAAPPASVAAPMGDGSLGIGSLKGKPQQ